MRGDKVCALGRSYIVPGVLEISLLCASASRVSVWLSGI